MQVYSFIHSFIHFLPFIPLGVAGGKGGEAHIYVYTQINTHVHKYTQLYTHLHAHTYIQTDTHIYIHIHTNTYTLTHAYTRTPTHNTRAQVHARTHTYRCTRSHMHTHAHAHTHAHTFSLLSSCHHFHHCSVSPHFLASLYYIFPRLNVSGRNFRKGIELKVQERGRVSFSAPPPDTDRALTASPKS